MTKVFFSNFEVGEPSILSRGGKSVIGSQTCCPDDLSGGEERGKYQNEISVQSFFSIIFAGCSPFRTDRQNYRGQMPEDDIICCIYLGRSRHHEIN
jgi:hypothetical protein